MVDGCVPQSSRRWCHTRPRQLGTGLRWLSDISGRLQRRTRAAPITISSHQTHQPQLLPTLHRPRRHPNAKAEARKREDPRDPLRGPPSSQSPGSRMTNPIPTGLLPRCLDAALLAAHGGAEGRHSQPDPAVVHMGSQSSDIYAPTLAASATSLLHCVCIAWQPTRLKCCAPRSCVTEAVTSIILRVLPPPKACSYLSTL